MRVVPFLLALTLLGAVASGASAAPRSAKTAANLCTVGKSIAASILHASASVTPTAATSPAALSKQLKATFTSIKGAESTALANSPKSLKPHFVKVFAYYNLVYAKLAKANWNVLALAKSGPALEAGERKIEPDIRAINAYINKCKK